MKFNQLTVILASTCLMFAQASFAGRIGGGKSYGMQRSMVRTNNNYTQSYNQPRYSQPQQQTTTQTQPRQGMGTGTAAVLGAAAGAAGGYMLGKSMAENSNNTNASATSKNAVSQETNAPVSNESHIPWGTVAILGLLLFLGLMLFRRRANAGVSNSTNNGTMNRYTENENFNIPTINRSSPIHNTSPNAGYTSAHTTPQAEPSRNLEKMPDGVETIYFLRQVKGMFLHIQSMNNPENIAEIEKYMTPELYHQLKAEINTNTYVADFPNLDCQLLESEATGNQLIASVKFFGLVSEEPDQPAKPFSEIWNFVKPDLTNNKWLVAGIQQETLA
jgi:predicted lipid-binding transport protein (Tim44 family)